MANLLLIRFGGVFVQSLAQAVLEAVEPDGWEKPSAAQSKEIRRFCDELLEGKVTEDVFFRNIQDSIGLEINRERLSKAVVSFSMCEDRAYAFLETLNNELPVRVLVDYPQDWFCGIIDTCRPVDRFSETTIDSLALTNLDFTNPQRLKDQLAVECDPVILEPDGIRARRLIRYGFQTIHHVDFARTIRELQLRNLISSPDRF